MSTDSANKAPLQCARPRESLEPKDPATYHRALRPSLWIRNASSCSPSGTGNWRGNSADAAARMLVPKPCMHINPSSSLLYFTQYGPATHAGLQSIFAGAKAPQVLKFPLGAM